MQNINIDGHGRFSGGEYEGIEINGAANCAEDIVCLHMEVNGHLSAGAVTADKLEVNGHLSVNGDLNTKNSEIDGAVSVSGNLCTELLDVDGHLSVKGTLNAGKTSVDGHMSCGASASTEDFDCDGMASFADGLRAKSVGVDGMLKVTGNIEAESIRADGKISSTAQISADTVKIFGIVDADEIVGDDISIEFKSWSGIAETVLRSIFGSKNNFRNDKSCANLIEATTINLEGVCAGVVSGENVTIGENCLIDRVDCTGPLFIDESSTVRLVNGQPYAPGSTPGNTPELPE